MLEEGSPAVANGRYLYKGLGDAAGTGNKELRNDSETSDDHPDNEYEGYSGEIQQI
jgi:hypothetical protein